MSVGPAGPGMASQIERIIIQVQNVEQLRLLREELELDRQELVYLREEFDHNRMSQQEWERVSQIVGGRIADNNQVANRLNHSVQTNAASMRDWRMNMLGLGYAMNDFFSVSGNMQQRLNSIANNLPMLLSGFGGLGIALSALAPIMGMVIGNWGAFKESITGAKSEFNDAVEDIKTRLKELEGKKIKLPVEIAEIETLQEEVKKLQDAVETLNRIKGTQTEAEREAGAAVGKAFEEGLTPQGKLMTAREMQDQLQARARMHAEEFDTKEAADLRNEILKQKATKDEIARLEKMREDNLGKMDLDEQTAINDRINNLKENDINADRNIQVMRELSESAAAREVGRLMNDAMKGVGEKQRKAIKDLGVMARQVGNEWLAEQLEQNTAEAVQERKAQETINAAQERRRKTEWELAKERIKFAMDDFEAIQLDETRLGMIGKEARAKFKDRAKQHEYISSEIRRILEQHVKAEVDAIPPGAEQKVRQMVTERVRGIVPRVPGIARAAEEQERARDAKTAQDKIDEMERHQLEARQNILKVLGEKRIAEVHKRLAAIDAAEGVTEQQKVEERGRLAQRLRFTAADAFKHSELNARQVNDAMKELIPSIWRDFQDQLKRMRSVMQTEQAAAAAAFMARPQGAPPPVLMNPEQTERAVRARLIKELQEAQGGGQARGGGEGGGFPSIAPVEPLAAAVERGQGALGQTQAAVATLNGRLARIEANQQSLARQAGMLQRAASDHQVSALPFGFQSS